MVQSWNGEEFAVTQGVAGVSNGHSISATGVEEVVIRRRSAHIETGGLSNLDGSEM